ncbi:zinc finger TRAF-type-containing protein 1-B-like [Ptychodera flava]|uniref:zinc finger TRAF-type-containing protein 1-B-like n=1 Tax=Ptychodera flava TaxID=63121 RepID=UPI00396A7EFB
MADVVAMASTESIDESLETKDLKIETEEPVKKKAKIDDEKVLMEEKLEQRLNGILCCAVCLDLPPAAIYQCLNGHLMCAVCFTHLLADARLKNEQATCPNCRCEISRSQCSRNLAVEKAVCELPAACQFCNHYLPRNTLDLHQREQCPERLTNCKYQRIGCTWCGPYHELKDHEQQCCRPKKSGAEIMEALQTIDQNRAEEMKVYSHIFSLLSFEKISLNDLQMRPYRSDDFIPRLYYETSRFSALDQQWVIKARINDNQREPSQTYMRTMSYQVVLKSRLGCNSTMDLYYIVLKGPFGEMKVNPVIYRCEFSNEDYESEYKELPLIDYTECNKLLAAKTINMRIIFFLVQK